MVLVTLEVMNTFLPTLGNMVRLRMNCQLEYRIRMTAIRGSLTNRMRKPRIGVRLSITG